MTGLWTAERTRPELRYPSDSVVVLAGIPGAGKTTLLRRLYPVGREYGGVRVFDSERLRARWMPVLGVVSSAWWRPLLHLTYYVLVLKAMRGGKGPMVVHDCATRPWVRRLIGWRAKRPDCRCIWSCSTYRVMWPATANGSAAASCAQEAWPPTAVAGPSSSRRRSTTRVTSYQTPHLRSSSAVARRTTSTRSPSKAKVSVVGD